MLDICFHVAAEDLIERSQESHETVTVDSGHFDCGAGDHVGCSWLAFEERTLTKVISRSVLLDFDGLCASLHRLCGNTLSINNEVEVIAFIALLDDLSSLRIRVLFDRICNLASLIVVHRLQNWNRGQKVLIAIALVLSSILHDMVESVPIELP